MNEISNAAAEIIQAEMRCHLHSPHSRHICVVVVQAKECPDGAQEELRNKQRMRRESKHSDAGGCNWIRQVCVYTSWQYPLHSSLCVAKQHPNTYQWIALVWPDLLEYP